MKALRYFQKDIKKRLLKYKKVSGNVLLIRKKKKYKKAEVFYLVSGDNYKNVFVLETSSQGKTLKQWKDTLPLLEKIIVNNILRKTKLKLDKILYIGLS